MVNQVEIDKATGRVDNQHAMAPGMRDWRYCPYCGSDFGGTGYRPGMRGPGYGHHNTFHPFQKPDIPMNAKEAKELARVYLSSIRNPNLKIGNVNEKSAAFKIEIVTKKTEDLVDIIAVNKNTGNLRSIY